MGPEFLSPILRFAVWASRKGWHVRSETTTKTLLLHLPGLTDGKTAKMAELPVQPVRRICLRPNREGVTARVHFSPGKILDRLTA